MGGAVGDVAGVVAAPFTGGASLIGPAIGAAGAIGSSLIGSSAASGAANTQANAANAAAQLQAQEFNALQQDLGPYMTLGTNSINQLNNMLGNGSLTTGFSFNPNQSTLEQTPGYQFQLQQGLNTLNNQLASKGLNLSQSQLQGAQNYAQGLASSNYQQQYQNALNNFLTNYGVTSNQYNRLSGLASLGENAAAGVGNAAMQTGQNIANLTTSGAAAQAAGQIGSANAIGAGLSGVGSNALLYSLLGNQSGGMVGGGGGGGFYGGSFSSGVSPVDSSTAALTGGSGSLFGY